MTKNLVPSLLLDIFGFSVDGRTMGSPSHGLSQFSPGFRAMNGSELWFQASVAAFIRVFHGKKPDSYGYSKHQDFMVKSNVFMNTNMAFIPIILIILDQIHIFMVKSRHFHGEVPNFSGFFQVYPESCAVSDGCVELNWLELQGLSLAVASHVQQMEAAVGRKLGGNCWIFRGVFGKISLCLKDLFGEIEVWWRCHGIYNAF